MTKVNTDKDPYIQLQRLQEEYRQQLPDRYAEVVTAWHACRDNRWGIDQLNTLHQLVRCLAGSGTTFGFTSLSDAAKVLAASLRNCIQNERSPSEDEIRQLEHQMVKLQQATQVKPATTASTELNPPVTPMEQQSKLIYLAEDDQELSASLAIHLRHFGYHVVTFHNTAALEQALSEQLRPDAVILDIILSESSLASPETLRSLRDKSPETMTVFLSARDDFDARLAAARAGGDAYFAKPADPQLIAEELDRLTQRRENLPFKVLIVDDDKTLASHYALLLRQAGMEVVTINNPRKVMESLADIAPELILMDVYMAECSGIELAKVIHQHAQFLSIPIVYLSSETNLEKQFSALRMGGDDCLTKPIDDEHLVTAITLRAQRARTLSGLMGQDSLTGLLKYTPFNEQLVAEISRAQRSGADLVLAMIDVDHFRSINDNYGHLTGDRVLKSISHLLRQRLRISDTIGRYGGEKFAVLFKECELEAACQLLEKIRADYNQVVHHINGCSFQVTFSAGLADLHADDSMESLIQAADQALYRAKEGGRNRIEKRPSD